MKSSIEPIAKSIGVVNLIEPRTSVPIIASTIISNGIDIMMVDTLKIWAVVRFRPVMNI